jgi:hypothetical protein
LRPSVAEPEIWRPNSDLNNSNRYIININITKIDKPRWFYNDLTLGKRVVCDIELNDLIKYCEIEYSIISGYIWRKGANTDPSAWVSGLYSKRKTDPDHQQIYKLMLNSIYGKCLRKYNKLTKPKQFTSEKEMKIYVHTHRQIINEINEETHEVIVNKCVDYTFNNAPFGVAIQAAARHRMNQLFNFCDIHNIDIYWSVCDSLLIKKEELSKFEKLNILGEGLGKLKIETETTEAIIKNKGAIYLNDNFYRWCGRSMKGVENIRDE